MVAPTRASIGSEEQILPLFPTVCGRFAQIVLTISGDHFNHTGYL